MSARGVTIKEAAARQGVSPSTIRRWIANGAPTVVLGRAGRGNGSLVDEDALQAWRAGFVVQRDDAQTIKLTSKGFHMAYVSAVDGHDRSAHQIVGLRDAEAAALYANAFLHVMQQLLGRELAGTEVPPEIRDLQRIAQTARR